MARCGVAATLVALVLLSGCGTQQVEPDSVGVSNAWVSDDGLRLRVIVDVCDDDAAVEIADQGDTVKLRASAPRSDSGVTRACQTPVIVQLKSTLGERPVIDAMSGNEVPVEVAPSTYDWGS